MKKRKVILVLLALLVLAYLLWRYLGDKDGSLAAESPDLGPNRVWIDSRPEKLTDLVNAFLMVDYAHLGIFQEASRYTGRYDLFEYRRSGAKVDLRFPQNGKAAIIEYTVTDCDDLHPYDLCLDMKENPWGGPTRYYGMRSEDESAATADLRARLEATVRPPPSYSAPGQ